MSKYDLPDKYDIKLTLTNEEFKLFRNVFKTAFNIHNNNDSMPKLFDKWQKIYRKIVKQFKQSLRILDTDVTNPKESAQLMDNRAESGFSRYHKEDHIFVLKPNEFRELKQIFKTAFRIHNNNDSMPLLLDKWQRLYTKIAHQYDQFIKDNYDGTGKIVGEDQSIGSG